MTQIIDEHQALFVAGYEKGRDDGVRQTITFVRIMFDLYDEHRTGWQDNPSRPLLPADLAKGLEVAIQAFARRRLSEGRRQERERVRRKAQKEAAA